MSIKGIKTDLSDLSEFTGQIDIDDDYTLVIIRFKECNNDGD